MSGELERLAAWIPRLPDPLAAAIHDLVEEEEARSADELAECVTALFEYVGAVAVADYLEGAPGAAREARDVALGGDLIRAYTASKGPEAGNWARWTQSVVPLTPGALLADYRVGFDLDAPGSDLRALSGFRNDVMHGGFVAPVRAIRAARAGLLRVVDGLSSLWAYTPVGCVGGEWAALVGGANYALEARPAPTGAERSALPETWAAEGAVVLVDEAGAARLALHPMGVRSPRDGRLYLGEAWDAKGAALTRGYLARTALRELFDRYEQERQGVVRVDAWHEEVRAALPSRGYVPRAGVLAALSAALARPSAVVRVVGAPGAGKTTLLAHLQESGLFGERVEVLPIDAHGPTASPSVVSTWLLRTLSEALLGETPVAKANKAGPERAAVEARLEAAAAASPVTWVIVIDDAEHLGAGDAADGDRRRCLALAQRLGMRIVLAHRPSGVPPLGGTATITLGLWSEDERAVWRVGGGPTERLDESGHALFLAHPAEGRARVRADLAARCREDALAAAVFDGLRGGAATAPALADRIGAFTPAVECTLRRQRDWLLEERIERVVRDPSAGEGRVRTERALEYTLHPAARAVLIDEAAR